MKKPFISKKAFKRREGKCHICEEKDYDLLETHRIKAKGKYSNNNCVCLCCCCHEKVTRGRIKVIGWFNSTAGRLLCIISENGRMQFI